MRRLIWLLALSLLVACGSSNLTLTNQTARYTVQLTVDSAKMGDRNLTIQINDKNGSPATVEQVVVAPVMNDMGMANPERTATATAPGRYQLQSEPLTMVGQWQIQLRIKAQGQEDTTTFTVPIT